MRCSCLPTYTPGPGPSTPICPPECLQAASVIVPTEQGLSCGESISFDLSELTDPGNCSNVSYSIFDVSNPGGGETLSVSIIGNTLTIENDATELNEGNFIRVEYLMNCTDDIRSVVGFIDILVVQDCV